MVWQKIYFNIKRSHDRAIFKTVKIKLVGQVVQYIQLPTWFFHFENKSIKNFEANFLRNRWPFINRKSAFVHNFWFPATLITDKFWSDSRLRRSHNFWWYFRSSDTFGDTFSSIAWSSNTFGDTFASTPASKNQFRNIPTRNFATCASGFGVPLCPSPPSPPPPP